ncbi:MAG: TadE/TadG family type IV pilus assembly protein [Elusimicrobiota bacterium]
MKTRAGRSGQVVVEMLLILPVFLGIVFTIMEIGYVSFQLIVLNHATYEVARVGGMTWLMPNGGAAKLNQLMASILPKATVSCSPLATLTDPQAGIQNMDLKCTGSESVPLIFPISSIILAKPAGSGHRPLSATVYMPIEQPLPQ